MILLTAHSLTPRGRFEVETCGLTLEERNSQIQFTLPVGEAELTTGDWIRDDTDPGAGIVYRIRTVETNYKTRTISCTAEHIIKVLGDTAIFGEVKPSDMGGTETSVSALNAIKNAINRQSDWVLNEQGFGYGSVSAGYTFNGDSVYEAIETVCSTLEDCWWSYDVSVYPFVLTIAHKATTATCEMRGGRNISSIRRTVDRSRMYTRIYPIGKENLHITGDCLSKNTNIYGVICKVETDQSIESEDHLRMWAQGRLNRHCEPSVNISINGLELSQETGEPLDHLTIGTVCRVPLPEFGTTLNETITKLQWRDKIKEPENVSVTLANEMEDVASIIRQEQASGGGTTGRAGRAGAKKAGEDHAWFVDTDDHVAMVAEAIVGKDGQGKPNWSRVSTLTVDGNGIDSRVTTTEGDMITAQSRIKQSETAISMTVGTYNNFTLVKKAKKSDFPATGAANTLYLDQSSGKYYVWIGGKYVDADVTTDDQGNPISASYVKAGEIAIAINDSGDAEAHIDAKKIILGKSALTSGDLDTWAYGAETGSGVFARYMTVETLTAQDVTTKKLDASFAITGQLSVDGQADFAQGVIVGDEDGLGYVEVDGPVYATSYIVNGEDDYAEELNLVDAEVDSTTGELKIWKVGDAENAPSITFSKATQLLGSLSGADGSKTLTISGSPTQTPALEYTISFVGSPDKLFELENPITPAPTASSTDLTKADRKKLDVPMKVLWIDPATETEHNIYATTISKVNASAVYDNGWKKAWGDFASKILDSQKDPETDQLVADQIWIKYPNSTVDGNPVYRRYSVDADAEKAYIKLGNTKVAEMTHNQYALGQASVKVAYNNAKVIQQGQQQDTIQAIEPVTSGGSGYLQLELDIGTAPTATSPSRTVGVKVGGSLKTELSETLNDYGNGYSAGNAHRASQISGYAIVTSGTVTATLQAEKKYLFQTQYQKADGTWGNGASYIFETPAGGLVTWPSAISKVTSSTQSATFTANGTTKIYGMYIGDFPNAEGTTVNAVQLITGNDVVAAIDINGLLTAQYQAGENHIKNAGGEYPVSSNGDFTLNQYVTILHVSVSGSHSPSISSSDIWTTERTLSGWTRADTLKSKYEQAKRDSEYVAFKVKCGGEEHVYYMEP